jgi:hypothetical protein
MTVGNNAGDDMVDDLGNWDNGGNDTINDPGNNAGKGMVGTPAGRGAGAPGSGSGGGGGGGSGGGGGGGGCGNGGGGGGGCILQRSFAFYCEDNFVCYFYVWGELVRLHLPSHSHHA